MMGGELRVQSDVLQVTFDVGGGQGPEHAARGLRDLDVDLLAGLVPACAVSRRWRASSPSSHEVGGLLVDFEAF